MYLTLSFSKFRVLRATPIQGLITGKFKVFFHQIGIASDFYLPHMDNEGSIALVTGKMKFSFR
jgi:hypothetical protein